MSECNECIALSSKKLAGSRCCGFLFSCPQRSWRQSFVLRRTPCCSCCRFWQSCRSLWFSARQHTRWQLRPATPRVGSSTATLGNLTELVIALTALRAGDHLLVKASIAGAIVTNTLFMLGMSLLFGGLKHHVQQFNRASARLQAALLFLGTVALLIPSFARDGGSPAAATYVQTLSLALAILLIAAYGLGMLFSLGTHRELFASEEHVAGEAPWPMALALGTLVGVTVLVALVAEIFVESVQSAAVGFGMTPAFVGFVIVALVGGAAEMASAFSGARQNRLDLSIGIALGSASQIALFVAPALVLISYVIAPSPMDLQLWPGAVAMMLIATLTAFIVANGGRSAWFIGVLVLNVYLVFATALYLLPPKLP